MQRRSPSCPTVTNMRKSQNPDTTILRCIAPPTTKVAAGWQTAATLNVALPISDLIRL